jgi:beta-N-acetylhexosaminidase
MIPFVYRVIASVSRPAAQKPGPQPARSLNNRRHRLSRSRSFAKLPAMPIFPEAAPSELFIVGFPGPELPPELAQRFARGDFAGLIFFARNFRTPNDPVATGQFLQSIGATYQPPPRPPGAPPLPPIFAIDHEGGRVQRLKAPLTVWPPMARLRAHPPALAYAVGQAMASELLPLGINVNFAPVLDINSNPHNPIIGDRAFGETAAAVSEKALHFLRGLESVQGLRGCGKHFPGHGDTATDSHLTLPVVDRDEATLRAVELVPFAEAVTAGIGMLMTAHVVYPAVDSRPATLSYRWLTEILRHELGFQGVVVSDDLDMNAVTAQHLGLADDSDVVVEALMAGCDAFLFCRDADRLARAEAALIKAAANDPRVRARIDQSASRLRAFRHTLAGVTADFAALGQFPDAQRQRLADELQAPPADAAGR